MSNNKELYKNLINTRLLNNNGGWMYCSNCDNTVGYLCYSTYAYFKFDFTCNCGEKGSIEIGDRECLSEIAAKDLLIRKGRLCCPVDDSPLFTVVNKNIKQFSYEVVCKSCLQTFKK